MAKTDLFAWVDSVSSTKEDLIESGPRESDYPGFMVNRALSQHSDAILYANEMNVWRDLDPQLQYDYLRLSVRKRTRRGKWAKADDTEAVDLVSWRYNLSRAKAREALSLLTDDHVQNIKKQRE